MSRRIILLSDGTGNSSAKVWRTNVWRMFSALDLSSDEQIACYDDGVGSSSFAPLALLGGMFGVGLRRNVISLYKFACRNYRAVGDEIYGFGFSRGAFTIRVTTGLIIDQGLIPAATISESELDRLAKLAYRNYHKKHFHTNWGLIYRQMQKWRGKSVQTPAVPPGRNIPIIRFLGLWDTVAAYGLPVDEMTRGLSQWIWPLEIPNHTLHGSIKRACHALSLDDERTTFHPVLWDEQHEVPQTAAERFTSGERLSQVWFSGVHANVGGGYPDDSLAQIPLYWIMQEAKPCGLTFKAANPEAVAETKQSQDKDGRLYDSREGFSSYYRYGPRRLSRLCNEVFSKTLDDKVSVATPKIHDSVFKRIKNNAQVYAPIGIPHDYELVVTVPDANGVDATFRIDPLPTSPSGSSVVYELKKDAEARVVLERAAVWPLVYLRAALYLLTILTTAFFLVFPLVGNGNVLSEKQNQLKWVSDLIRTAGGFLPGWISPWFVAYAEYPVIFLIVVVVLCTLLFASQKTASAISDRMTALWRNSLAHTAKQPATPPTNTLTRTQGFLVKLRSSWKDYLGPALSAIGIVYIAVTFPNRWLFTALDEAGLVCTQTLPPSNRTQLPDIPDHGIIFLFDVSTPCFATGYKVDRLDKFLIWTSPPSEEEIERRYPGEKKKVGACSLPANGGPDPLSGRFLNGTVETDARGYSTFINEGDYPSKSEGVTPGLGLAQTIWNALLLPLKRHYGEPWFRPVARYGSIGSELDFLEPDPDSKITKISENIVPKVSGELFFYVNDAVIGLPSFQVFYRDNIGCAKLFVLPTK
jgi:hypothetical protein